MDTDRPGSEEASSDQPTPTIEEQGPSQVRSYECIFCKRGFSNAQALGGHMNIHRKDKAKLKKPSADQTTSSQQHHHQFGGINSSPRDVMSPYSSIPTTTTPQWKPPELKPSDDERKLSNITWPNWMLQKEEIGGGANRIKSQTRSHGGFEVKQLSLFSEIPRVMTPDDQIQEQSVSKYVDQYQDVYQERLISHGDQSGSDIDLELRLGPEPQDSSPTNKGTKRFF